LVSDANAEGTCELAWSTRVVEMLTRWPPPPSGQHRGDDGAGYLEETAKIHARDGLVVGVGVFGERLRDEDACVVDQCVDAAEPVDCRVDDAPTNSGLRDVAGNRQHHRVVAGLDLA
jgi:hypothetical protein